MAGESFTLNITVRNLGSGSSSPTTLTYYRSTDSTITSGDKVGTVQVSRLDASGSSTESISLTAPSVPGTYYYGVCVDSVSGESDTTNNCSNAVAVPVLPPPPDLIVDTPSVSHSTPMAGESFTLNITVRNRGSGSSSPTTLSFYQSTDSITMPGDTEVGTVQVSGLDASGSSAESVLTNAPSTPGTYYYGACVDSVSRESDTTNNCSNAVAVTVSEFKIENLTWVADGITDRERRAMDDIRALAQIDPSMSQRVAGSPWLSDGVIENDLARMAGLLYMGDTYPEIAVLVTTVPGETGRLMDHLLASLPSILFNDLGRSKQVLGQSWFRDGLTEEEAALIVVLRNTEEVFVDLLQGGHVRSETISLPLAGEVDLFAVGRSELELEGSLERMVFGVESIESFMGTPWPDSAVIALLELESDLGRRQDRGWYAATHIVVKNPFGKTLFHELGHYYFRGRSFPRWLTEGGADFLAYYTSGLTGHGLPISTLYFEVQNSIAEHCAPRGAANVQEWIETKAGSRNCPYWLGYQFLAGMYRTLGHEVVSSGLRELHETTGGRVTEDEIYQTFLRNTPSSQRDEYRFWYHCLHGRPIPGYTAAPKAAPSPEIRDALAALYNATNGPGWKNSENWLSEVPLDQWYGVFTDCDGSLAGLDLGENGLTGPIPSELGSLSHLELLWLSDNQLTGPIPPELGNLSKLRDLRLSGNQLTGPIPSELGSLSELQRLWLSGNQLTGPIPPELGNLSELQRLWLSGNHLTGPISPELGNLSKLRDLRLSGNRLTGPIPSELGSLSGLQRLWLSGNQLTGPIPPELGNLSEDLRLSGNQLTGPIPSELGSLSGLQRLWLSGNQLTGRIPPELGNLSKLRDLRLSGNQLTGPIPSELGSLSHLELLWLSGNQLTGCVPARLKAIEINDVEHLVLEVCKDS